MKEKRASNSHGDFVLRRYGEQRNFVCDRCLEPKVSKIEVEWVTRTSDEAKRICNGCFGRLSSGV
jgi:hypothetical protein